MCPKKGPEPRLPHSLSLCAQGRKDLYPKQITEDNEGAIGLVLVCPPPAPIKQLHRICMGGGQLPDDHQEAGKAEHRLWNQLRREQARGCWCLNLARPSSTLCMPQTLDPSRPPHPHPALQPAAPTHRSLHHRVWFCWLEDSKWS